MIAGFWFSTNGIALPLRWLFPTREWAAASIELLEFQYFASRSFDLTERNVIMNKPD